MQKRGQAAMEFLMTYGWALLVVLIAIGALAFFGVLNPSRFLPQSCVLGPGLACEDFKVTVNDRSIYMNVRNGLGRDLDVFFVYIDKKTGGGSEVCGGITGIVALPPPASAIYPLFRDGTVRPLLSQKDGDPLGESGINCDIASPYLSVNCCSTNGVSSPLVCGLSSPCMCIGYSCFVSSQLPDKAGRKFNQDIIIVYKELNSVVLHQRVGRLTSSTELE